jgi:hypothetical protein
LLGIQFFCWHSPLVSESKLNFQTVEELERWLSDKPLDWAQIVAARRALRVLPWIRDASNRLLMNDVIHLLRSSVFAWAAINYPSLNFSDSGIRAAIDTESAAVNATIRQEQEHVRAAVNAVSDVAASVGSIEDLVSSFQLSIDSLAAANTGGTIRWQEIQRDCEWLAEFGQMKGASRNLSRLPLSLRSGRDIRPRHLTNLIAIDLNYAVWIHWYERRVRGERAAFDIPGDKGRKEDKKILRRLAEATDEDFWGKGHEYVNATLKGWLDEARERVAPPTVIGTVGMSSSTETALNLYPAPTQNRNAISFRTDEAGRITIDASASVDQLRTDAEARDRHSEAASEAQSVLDRCRGNNAAARLTLRLENYLAAIGPSIEGTKPSLLVQRGEKLRQELAAYAAPDTLLDPIADDILVDLRGWQSSHNMMVGLDPVLIAIDTAMLGPDRRPALIPPEEIKQFVHDAQEADLLAEGTEEIIIEAADLAPTVPDPNDRRTNASIEMVRNLCIEAVSIVLNNPKISVAAITVSLAASSNAVAATIGGISIMSSIKAAEYLVAHRQWIEDRMGNTPTWQTLFLRVADWLEKYTPFKPK